jgi:hypothetical protein
MQVTEEFKTHTNALYKKLYETIRDATPEDMPNGLEVALTALNSLAVVLAMRHDVTRESFLENVASIFDQYSALANSGTANELH